MKRVLLIFGTRPEAIKLAPVYFELKKYPDFFDVKVCITGQHREMIDQAINFFSINVDYDLNLMSKNQSLSSFASKCIKEIDFILRDYKPNLVLVQGDTLSAFIGAFSSVYRKIKIGHVEAGLRSFDKYSPFPEEINRILISHIADYHFAPTKEAKKNLIKENIKNNIWVVGNTVIDALFFGLNIIKSNIEIKKEIEKFFYNIGLDLHNNKKIILVTSHRRENFGDGLKNICNALIEIANKYKDLLIVYPVHMNPNVKEMVMKFLTNTKNIILTNPLSYAHLIYLMSKSYIILTDSGGIQEEAPSLKKPILVLRNVTERIEGVNAGTSILVGTKKEEIVRNTQEFIENPEKIEKFKYLSNPYGDGKASKRIVRILKKILH